LGEGAPEAAAAAAPAAAAPAAAAPAAAPEHERRLEDDSQDSGCSIGSDTSSELSPALQCQIQAKAQEARERAKRRRLINEMAQSRVIARYWHTPGRRARHAAAQRYTTHTSIPLGTTIDDDEADLREDLDMALREHETSSLEDFIEDDEDTEYMPLDHDDDQPAERRNGTRRPRRRIRRLSSMDDDWPSMSFLLPFSSFRIFWIFLGFRNTCFFIFTLSPFL
jgi:hypothetical protein